MVHFDRVAVAFAGLLVPFLGLVGLLNERLYRAALYFWIAMVGVFFAMLFVAGAGVTPERGERPFPSAGLQRPMEIVTPQETKAWFDTPWVREDIILGVAGLAFAVPFLVLTWAYRNRNLSRPLKIATHVVETLGFLSALWAFFASLLIPYLRQLGV
jgi:hypothetical protein